MTKMAEKSNPFGRTLAHVRECSQRVGKDITIPLRANPEQVPKEVDPQGSIVDNTIQRN